MRNLVGTISYQIKKNKMVVKTKCSDFSLRLNNLLRKIIGLLSMDSNVLKNLVARVAMVYVKPFNYEV